MNLETAEKKKIVVVDDDATIAEVMQQILAFEGYEVEVVYDGQAAVDAHLIMHPDLMIMDVSMPVKDGLTACKEIREKDSQIPILMVTAQKMQVNTVAGLNAGADDYLTKPVGYKELVARVRALFRRSES